MSFIDIRNHASGNGANDDTAGVQAAVEAAYNGTLYVSGAYKLSAEIVVEQPLQIIGATPDVSYFLTSSASQNGFRIATEKAVVMRDFGLISSVAKTAGAGFLYAPSTGSNTRPVMENVVVSQQFVGVHFQSAAQFRMVNNHVYNSVNYGVIVDNLAAPDSGDSTISGCTFDSSNTESLAAVLQQASGGLRFCNNKVLRHQRGIMLVTGNGVSTSILKIAGNSFEHQKLSSVYLNKTGTGMFYHFHCSGNQINAANAGTFWQYAANPFGIQQAGSGWLKYVSVVDNTVQLNENGGIGMEFADARIGTISDNTFIGSGGQQRIGVSLGASCDALRGTNTYHGLTMNVSNASATCVVN